MLKKAIADHDIVLTLCEADFEQSMGRHPRNQAEFSEWAHLLEKGLCNGHIDWDILYRCTQQAMGDSR